MKWSTRIFQLFLLLWAKDLDNYLVISLVDRCYFVHWLNAKFVHICSASYVILFRFRNLLLLLFFYQNSAALILWWNSLFTFRTLAMCDFALWKLKLKRVLRWKLIVAQTLLFIVLESVLSFWLIAVMKTLFLFGTNSFTS